MAEATPEQPLSEAIHSNIINHLVRFIAIGGMPEVVKTYIEQNDLLQCQQVRRTLEQINKGDIAELFAGLEMLKAMPTNLHAQLYYWQREKNGSHAQVDYLIQKGNAIIPVEVKSGTTGKMQSLHLFMREKQSEYGIRCSLENFSQYDKIKVFPLYAISNFINK